MEIKEQTEIYSTLALFGGTLGSYSGEWDIFWNAYVQMLKVIEIRHLTPVSVKYPESFSKCQSSLLRGNKEQAHRYLYATIMWYKTIQNEV